MRARYYHPGLRRFVNQDPIGFGGGMNWYGYAGAGPATANDPSGFMAMPGQYGAWKNSDGSINWGPYLIYAFSGVPDYIAQNWQSSFVRNITDPKFVMENAAGGFGFGAALNGFSRTAQATAGVRPGLRSIAGTAQPGEVAWTIKGPTFPKASMEIADGLSEVEAAATLIHEGQHLADFASSPWTTYAAIKPIPGSTIARGILETRAYAAEAAAMGTQFNYTGWAKSTFLSRSTVSDAAYASYFGYKLLNSSPTSNSACAR